MKPFPITHVAQKHERGCLVACIAMVLGWDYDKVVTAFENDFNKKGTSAAFAQDFICAHGFSVIEKRGSGYVDISKHNERMMKPIAPIHIVSIQQFVDKPDRGHSFVMDGNGRIYEPSDPELRKLEFYQVKHVMGFFRD